MKTALVDFHTHTTCSDGAWSRERLFDEIRRRGVERFCVSDHDTMDAYPVPEDLRARCVPGLEVDSYGFGQTVHVLGYGVDPGSELLRRLGVQREQRRVRAQSIIERLNGLGIAITYEQVLRCAGTSTSVGRPHIARALVEAGHCADLQQAFDRYLADGGTAYVELSRLTTAQAIDLIHEGGGIAVLAHPMRLRDQSRLQEASRLFDGIEIVHPSADEAYRRKLEDLADASGLLATGGTDFHGRSTDPPIGVSFPAERLQRFLEKVSAPGTQRPAQSVG